MHAQEVSRSFIREAVAVGLLGAAIVALWFFFVDLLNGTPFRTPAILGSAVFLGISSPDEAVMNVVTVGLYSILHGAAFFLVGVGATAMVRAADRTPSLLLLFIILTVVLQALFVGGVAIVAQFILGVIAWPAVLGSNLLASLGMGLLLLYWHPVTAERLKGSDEPFA